MTQAIAALAADYDGTLARRGQVADATRAALVRLKQSGRKLLMVTGRQAPHLAEVFSDLGLFDVIVAENGALLRWPGGVEQALGPSPPPAFVAALQRRIARPLEVGRSIVATARDHEAAVWAAIAETGVDWRPIFNKDSVMCLPPGVDKGTGLAAALAQLGLAPAAVLGVGDAENDLPFLQLCGVSAVVANALPQLKAVADVVAPGDDGEGVSWLIEQVLGDGLHRRLRQEGARAG